MLEIGGLRPPAPAAPRSAAASGGFTVGSAPAATPPAAAPLARPASVDAMLLLQEVADAPERDRQARRHGRALLDALAQLQLALLGDSEPALSRLAALASHSPQASDPALQAILASIALRTQIELARRRL